MPSLSRRKLLTVLGSTGTAMMSGCSTLNQKSQKKPSTIGGIDVINFSKQRQIIHILIEKDGSKVYKRTKKVDGASGSQPSGAVFHGYPKEPAQYTISVWKDDGSRNDGQQIDFANYNSDCLSISVQIGDYNGTPPNSSLSILTSTNCASK